MSTFNIQVTPQNNTLVIVDNDQNQVVVTNPITSVVEVVTQGPQGPVGPQGPSGTSFPYTGSAIISGSVIVTGSIVASQGFTGSLLGTASYALNAQRELFTFYTNNERLDDWAFSILNTTPTRINGSPDSNTVFLGVIQSFEIINDSIILEVLDIDGNNITSSLGISTSPVSPGIYFSSFSGSYFSGITLGQASDQIVDLYLYQDPTEYDPSTYITTSSLIIENDVYIEGGDLYGNLVGTSSYAGVSNISTDSINSASIDINNNITLYKNLESTYNIQIEPFRYYSTDIQLNEWAQDYLNYSYGTSSLSGTNTITGKFSLIEILTPTKITAISSSEYGDVKSRLGISHNPTLDPGIYFSGYPDVITFTTLSLASGDVRLYHTSSLPTTYEGTYFTDNSIKFNSGITGSLLGTSSYATQALSSSYALTASYVTNTQDQIFTFYTNNERLDDWAFSILNTTPTRINGSPDSNTVFLGAIQAFEVVNDSTILEVLDIDGNNITSSLGISPSSINSGIYFSSPSGSYFSGITLGQASDQIVDLYLYQDPTEYDPSTYITTSSLIIENDVYIEGGDLYSNLIGTSSYANTAGTSIDSMNSASINIDNTITLYKNSQTFSTLQVEPFRYYNTDLQLNEWAQDYLNYSYGTSSLSGNNTITGNFSIIEILTPTKITAISSSVSGSLVTTLGIISTDFINPGVYFSGYPNVLTFNTLSLSEGSVRLYHTASIPVTYQGTYFTDNSIKFNSGITGSLQGTASYSIYAITASYAMNGGGGNIDTGSFVTTSSFNAFTSSINAFTSSYNTGSFTGSFTGSLLGTSSFSISSSRAINASFAVTASTSITESRTITFNLGSIPTPLTTGSKTNSIFYSPYSGSIKGFILTSNTGSTTTLNIWKRNNTLPTSSDTIITTNKPQLINNQFTSSYNISGWTTSFSPNDVFLINVETNTSASNLSLQLITEIYK